jgi:AraC-like DNA-binding protein
MASATPAIVRTPAPGHVAAIPQVQGAVPMSALRECVMEMRAKPARARHTDALSSQFGVPSSTFIRSFKRLTGLSPQRFRAALRIELAKRLLVDTERRVTDISLDVGYSSLGTFVRTFSLLVGISPIQLRRLARGESVHDVLRGEQWLRTTMPDGRKISANLEIPVAAGPFVAAGLFRQNIPAGLPLTGCFIDPRLTSFALQFHPDASSLMVAAVGPFDAADGWAGRLCSVFVASCAVDEGSSRLAAPPMRLRLRPLVQTDPPILTPVPLLMLMQAQRSVSP